MARIVHRFSEMDGNDCRWFVSQSGLRWRNRRSVGAVYALLALASLAGISSCSLESEEHRIEKAAAASIGSERRGRELADRFGCGACHVIPGVQRAEGRIGPPLNGIAKRIYVAGALPNIPPNMIAWLQHPQRINPATAMPDVGLSETEARDVAAFLYTLK